MKHSLLSYLNHISSLTNDGTDSHPAYLIFVRNAVSVKFLAECKKIPEKKQENYCFGLRLYRSSNVLFYTKCVILHLVCNFTLSV